MNGPNTSASEITTSDTQALINQTIQQQLTAIGERLNKIEQMPVKKTSGSYKSKGKSAGTKHKVVNQSHSTQTSNHSVRTRTKITGTHAALSTEIIRTSASKFDKYVLKNKMSTLGC